jgi:hypothetical protein
MDFGDIFLASSADGGQSFASPINVSASPGPSFGPTLVSAIGGPVFLAWTDGSINFTNEIFFAASSNGGNSFACSINLSNTPTSSQVPQVAANDVGLPTVIWHDQDEFGGSDILLSVFDPEEPTVTIDSVSNNMPLWDIDLVEVSGGVGNAAGSDSVTIDWGDGQQDTDVPINGCQWGPVSHSYASSTIAQNPNIITAKLVASDDSEKAASSPVEISTQQHFTSINLEPVSSVVQGSILTVAGTLVDGATGLGIAGQTISFDGSGAANLEDTVTDADGVFTTSGNATDESADHLLVQARYAGSEEFLASDSDIESYDTVSPDAIQFNVTAGQGVNVDLEDFFSFNGSVTFDDVAQDGIFYASECETPDSPRYLSIDVCLRISSAVEMVDGTGATVALAVPNGTTVNGISLFHEEFPEGDSPVIVDITSSRDTDQVLGRTSSFSEFILGVAQHEAKPAGAYRQEVFVGTSNQVALRDITNLDNSTASVTASFDRDSYDLSDTATLSITDYNGNVSSTEIDIVQAMVKSETSVPFGIEVVLTETAPASSVFTGNFEFTSGESSSETGELQAEPGDSLSVGYLSGGRFQAVIEGLDESGIAQLSDFVVESSVCMKPVGGAVNLELIDASLGPSGIIVASLSYANADTRGVDPANFRLMQKQDATWIDITQAVDLDAMTVSGETSIDGAFTIAFDLDDCGGGSGGGLGRPGSGLVVDFVASVARPQSSENTGSGGGSGGGGSRSVAVTSKSGTTESVPAGEQNEVVVTLLSNQAGAGIGLSEVSLIFQNVISGGSVSVATETLAEASDLFDSIEGSHASVGLDDASYTATGIVYDIEPSSLLNYEGTVDVTIPYDPAQIQNAGFDESNIRLIHHDGSDWQDVTIDSDAGANTVTGRLASGFSPVVAALVEDGTYADSYFAANPLARIALSGSTATVGVSSSPVQAISAGDQVTVSATLQNTQRTMQSYVFILQVLSPDGTVDSLEYQIGQLQRADSTTISMSWTPEIIQSGHFQARIFVLSSLEDDLEVLTEPTSIDLDVDA